MAKKNQLSKVSIDRVDLVDRPANPGARIAMFKRDFSQDERDKAADTGAAMPDGSFPIKNAGDLANAIRLAGNAKDPAAARKHIIARAKTLGASDKIPDTWVKKSIVFDADGDDAVSVIFAQLAKDYPEMTSPPVDLGDPAGHVHAMGGTMEQAQTFDDVTAEDEAEDYSNQLLCDINDATCRLRESVCSILGDDEVADKQKMLEETFKQYHECLQALASEGVRKALGHAVAANEGEQAVTPEQIQTAITAEVAKQATAKDTEIAALKADLAKKEGEIAFGKLSDAHKDAAKDMGDDEKSKFLAMSAEERDAHLKKRASPELPAEVKKALDEVTDLKKQNAEFAAERETVAFAKRAVEIGLVEDQGEILRKAYKGDKDSITKLEELIKGLNEQVKKGSLFKEFGNNQGGTVIGGALAQLNAKRDELMKSDSKLTSEQAFSKVYNDPANKELKELEKRERMSKAA